MNKKINELMTQLESAYQESAIESAIETTKECKLSKQEFADECCYNYRDTLNGLIGYGIKDIYDGFRKYGDETLLQSIAYEIYNYITLHPTPKQRKQELYNETTKARKHFLATERRISEKVKKARPDLKWYEQFDLVHQDIEYIKAETRLLALCEACNIIGVECGE